MSGIIHSALNGATAPSPNAFNLLTANVGTDIYYDVPGQPHNYALTDMNLTVVRAAGIATGEWSFTALVGFRQAGIGGVFEAIQTIQYTGVIAATGGFDNVGFAIQRNWASALFGVPNSNIVIYNYNLANVSAVILDLDISGFIY